MTTGVVPLENRGTLPFGTVHGRPLLEHAVAALRSVPALDRVVVTVDPDQLDQAVALVGPSVVSLPEEFWADPPDRVLLHDCLCPLVPATFLARLAGATATSVSFRPVTDTLKVVEDDRIGGTVDREEFGIVTSPLLLVGVAGRPPTHDFGATTLWLRERCEPALVRAPSIGRRVADPAALSVLESVDAMARTVRET